MGGPFRGKNPGKAMYKGGLLYLRGRVRTIIIKVQQIKKVGLYASRITKQSEKGGQNVREKLFVTAKKKAEDT